MTFYVKNVILCDIGGGDMDKAGTSEGWLVLFNLGIELS